MTAIIRLKRKIGDDPVESLMISSKRFKSEDKKCKLAFAGTADNWNGCLRVAEKALRMEYLESCYSINVNEPSCISSSENACPADDLRIVSQVGAHQLENLFKQTESKISLNSQSKFRLLDLEKESEDSYAEHVYDIFYTRDGNILNEPVHDITFMYCYTPELKEVNGMDELEKEEADLEINYFNDEPEAEGHWSADYPDEFNVFFIKEEENPSSGSEDEKYEQHETENDYGEYLEDFVNKVCSKIAKKNRKTLKSATSMLEGFHINGDH